MLCFVRAVRCSQTGAECTARMEMCSGSPSACLDSCNVDFGSKRRDCRLAMKPGCLAQGASAWDTGSDGWVLRTVGLPRMFSPFAMHVSYVSTIFCQHFFSRGVQQGGNPSLRFVRIPMVHIIHIYPYSYVSMFHYSVMTPYNVYAPIIKRLCVPAPNDVARCLHTCDFVGAFCLFVLSNLSTTCVCITGVFQHLPACVGGDWSGGLSSLFVMVGACCWRGRLCFVRGRDSEFVLYISLFLRMLRWWVGGCLYTCVHTHKLLGFLTLMMWA